MNYKKITAITVIVFSVVFSFFVLLYEIHVRRQARIRMEEHARVISDAMWNYNEKVAYEYLLLALRSEGYHRLVVIDDRNEIFLDIREEDQESSENWLISLGLIPRIFLSAVIFHNGAFIGRVHAVWYCKSIYVYFYVLFAMALGVVVVYLYTRLFESKRDLEDRVRARTLELERSNESLKNEIIERKSIEKALRESEEKFRTALEAYPDPVIIYDREGRMIYFNPAFTEVFGWLDKDSADQNAQDSILLKDLFKDRQMLDRLMSGQPLAATETKMYSGKGEVIPVIVSGGIFRDENGQPSGRIINIKDISEYKKMQDQLLRGQRMESIGTLAGGVAHDFNNILMGIQGNVSLLLFDMRETDAAWPKLKTMEKYIQQGANLSRQILSFARGVRHETKPVDINEVVQKTLDLLQRTHKEISIEIDCQKDVYPVIADQTQIEQALMNLYVNACQAMTTGGVLKIGTKNVYPGQRHVKSVGQSENKFVQISVMDTGIGMDNNTRERIFDPFFTTKEMGKGTGLGLASVYSIVKNHGGTIEVYSEKGKGSRFEILLPSTDSPARREFPSMEPIVKGTETILLVDDEEMILEIGGEILKKIGYRVLQANSGQKALDLYRHHQDEIDLVILDMIMPDMDGKQVYDRLKQIYNGVKVLVSSGFSMEGTLENVLEKPSRGFIQKPFRIEELSRKIREILN